MEISLTGRHVEVAERFRRHLEEKLGKVEQIAPRIVRVDVVLTREPNPRQAKAGTRVEITCQGKSAVVRAEAAADEEYAALDAALARLLERLRRASDRRRVHRGRHAPESVSEATARIATDERPAAAVPAAGQPDPESDEVAAAGDDAGDSPIEVREKVHGATPMSLDQALYAMELVGHDFYLYEEATTGRPSVVYRRRGWSYGVIHLESSADGSASAAGAQSSAPTALRR